MSRKTCFYKGRLAQFDARADRPESWQKQYRSYSTAELEQIYLWADKGALGVYRQAFLKYLPCSGLVVEAGCGTGRYVRALIWYGFNVVGIEWEYQIIKRAKQVWPDAPLICGDVRRFPFPDQSVDAVISLGVIEHFDDPWDVLKDSVRILKRGGILYLVVPYVNHFRRFLAALGRYPEPATEDQFYQFLLSDGGINRHLQVLGFVVKAHFSTGAFAGLSSEFPRLGYLIRKVPYANHIINGINKLHWLGPLLGHVVHYIAEKK